MFNNVGKKIQSFSEVITGFSVFVLVFLGIIGLLSGTGFLFLITMLLALLSWIIGMFLYDFGQLIENVDRIINILEKG